MYSMYILDTHYISPILLLPEMKPGIRIIRSYRQLNMNIGKVDLQFIVTTFSKGIWVESHLLLFITEKFSLFYQK